MTSYKKHNCDLRNESECREDIENEEGISLEEAEDEFFDD